MNLNLIKIVGVAVGVAGMTVETRAAVVQEYVAERDNTQVSAWKSHRPEKRLFTSKAVEEQIQRAKKLLTNTKLAWMFENCFPNTLDTTVHFDGADDTFVYTGDIHAMWLRDSGAQVWPYVQLANEDPELKKMLDGVIRRQFRCINIDPYANAFNKEATGSYWASDMTDMKPEVYERKWEIDSLCYPIRLAYHYWKVTGDDGTVLAEGNKEVACEPHATVELTLGAVQLPKTIREAYLDLGWTRKKSTPLVDTAWEIAYDQFVLPASGKVWNGKPSEAGKTTFEVDENTGALKSLCLDGEELLASPVTISLFRPATDNDNRDRMGAKLWRKAGLHTLTQKVVSLKESKTSATAQVNILNVTGKKVGDATLEYTLNHNGSLKVQTTFQPDTTWVKSIARLGLTFEMNDTYGNVTYLGRGEHETYIDRNQSGKIGIYTTTPEKMFHYYVIPQSTGNRTDVRWVKLADDSGKGCWIESDSPFQFSALPFSDLLLEKALHINDLERNGRITVHLDAKQAGVGTATCGPGVLPPYLVPLGKQTFTFTIYPVK